MEGEEGQPTEADRRTGASDASTPEDEAAEEKARDTICLDFTKNKCNRGSACKFTHDVEVIARVNAREEGICYDWQKGTCTRGKLCRFSHDPEKLAKHKEKQAAKQQELGATGQKSSQVCYQFTGGRCTQPDCKFSHDLDAVKRTPARRTAASVEVCFDYTRGKCSWGARCKYAHDPRLTRGNAKPGLGPRVSQPAMFSRAPVRPSFLPGQRPQMVFPGVLSPHPAQMAAMQRQQQLMQHQQLMQALPDPMQLYPAQQQQQYPMLAPAAAGGPQGAVWVQPRAIPVFMPIGQSVFMQPLAPGLQPDAVGHTRHTSLVDQFGAVRLDNAASLPAELQEGGLHEVSLNRGETMSCPGLSDKSISRAGQGGLSVHGNGSAQKDGDPQQPAGKGPYAGSLRMPGSIGADWGFQPTKTSATQSGAQLPASGASTPLASRPSTRVGSPAWQAWPGSHPGTPARQTALSADTSRDPVCAPPPRHQLHFHSICRPKLGSEGGSESSAALGATEDAEQEATLLEKLASIWAQST